MKKISDTGYVFPADRIMTDISTCYIDSPDNKMDRLAKLSLDQGGILTVEDTNGGYVEIYDFESFCIAVDKLDRLNKINQKGGLLE